MDHLLRHSLGRLCFVFVGRVDPVLPLYRYRLTDSILEIRAPDLAFSDDEAALLLKSTGVELAHEVGHDLNQRLSGWAAGLRFAARALVAREDRRGVRGDGGRADPDINEYLVAEVLDSQPPEVRRFLLDSCVTAEFCTDLVARVGGASAVHTMSDLVDRRAFVAARAGSSPAGSTTSPSSAACCWPSSPTSRPSGWRRYDGRLGVVPGPPPVRRVVGAAGDDRRVAGMATQLVDAGLVGRLLLEDQGGAIGDVARCLPPRSTTPRPRWSAPRRH